MAILWLVFLSDNDSCTLIFLMSPVFSLRFPPKLCTMCNCLHCAISLRFPLDSILATGTVIFLRFFNPALGNILSWSPLWLWAPTLSITTTILLLLLLLLSWFPGPSGIVIVAVVSHCDTQTSWFCFFYWPMLLLLLFRLLLLLLLLHYFLVTSSVSSFTYCCVVNWIFLFFLFFLFKVLII